MKKFAIYLFACMLISMGVDAQELKVFEEWATSSGTQNMFLETFTETNASGGVYIGGATLNSNGEYDILLTRYGRRGNLLWTVQYAGSGGGDDAAAAMCLGDSGNVYITGTVYSSSTNQNDCVVLKYDAYGNLKWVRTYNGNANGPDFGTDICIDVNNNVYIGGATTRTSTYYDFLVLKYDRGGNPQWVNYYDNLNLFEIANNIEVNGSDVYVAGGTQVSATGYEYAVAGFSAANGAFNGVKVTSSTGTGIDQINDLCLDDNGNIYVTGGVVNATSGYDYKTIKLNDSLDVEWTALYNGTDNLDDMGRSIAVDDSGYVYVTGYSATLAEDTNMVTLKYDSVGTIIWTQEYNNSNDSTDKGEALIVDASGNVYVTGTTHNGSNTDYLTLKYNSSGDLKWEMTYNGPTNGNDQALDICIDNDGYVYVVGQCEDGPSYKYYTVMYAEIEVIVPPDQESISNSISYIKNVGQLLNTAQNPASDVKFYSTGTSPRVYFEDENISFVFNEIVSQSDSCGVGDSIQYHRCEMEFHEADPDIVVRAYAPNNDYFNYYLAHIPKGRERVQHYERVIYSNLFDDIDLHFSNNSLGYKFYYIIKPGADPTDIEFAFSGTDSMYINTSDHLVLATSLGEMVFNEGAAYQINSSGNKVSLTWQPEFVLNNSTVNFSTGTYDNTLSLVFEIKQGNSTSGISSIDNLEWCTYYGEGTSWSRFFAVETNVSKDIWVVGSTASNVFPVVGGNGYGWFGNGDAVLLRFDNNGGREWAVFYGGSFIEYYNERIQRKSGITVDDLGNSYIAGSTSSTNIPLKADNNEYIDSTNVGREIFIAEFDIDGKLQWSTYYGDDCNCNNLAASYDLKLDNNDNLYVTGIVPGAPQVSPLPFFSYYDAFIAEFNTANQLIWSTNYGGTWKDYIRDIDFDSNNDLFLTGETESTDFPVKKPGNGYFYDSTLYGFSDAFIAKITEAHDTSWAMYIGCDTADIGTGISIDNNDNIYICGVTYKRGLPVYNMGSPAYFEALPLGTPTSSFDYNGDGFLAKFTNLGQRLHCTYYGGLSGDGFSDIGVDGNGNVYVTGTTASNSVPFANPNFPNFFIDNTRIDTHDGLILSFDSDFRLQWTTFFGGYENDINQINRDWVTGLTITDDDLNLFVVGETNSSIDFPLVQSPNAYFDSLLTAYSYEGFISKFNLSGVINVESLEATNNNILVYPNPATTTLFIETDKEIENYSIFNITGQLIKTREFSGPIHIEELPQGIYLLNIMVDNKPFNTKFIKN